MQKEPISQTKCARCDTDLIGEYESASLSYTDASTGATCVRIFPFCGKCAPNVPPVGPKRNEYLVGLLISAVPNLSAYLER
jgi:hypothetical protein